MTRHLLRFLALGALLLAVDVGLLRPSPLVEGAGSPEVVVVSRAQVEELQREWRARSGGPASERDLSALIERAAIEEILARRGLAQGLHRSDPVIVQRLVRNMRFLEGNAERTSETLYREALALGMHRSDPVVRRRLVQRALMDLRRGALVSEPDEEEIAAFVARHPERFQAPQRVRFTQVTEVGSSALPRDFGPASEREVAAFFGPRFAREVLNLAPGRWHASIRSARGTHRVWVHEIRPGALPPIEQVRERARLALRAEAEERALRLALERLRAGVRVEVEGVEAS